MHIGGAARGRQLEIRLTEREGTVWRKARRWRSGELFYPRGLSCSEATNMIDNRRQDGAPHRRRAKGGGAAVRQYPRNEGRRRPTHRPPSAVRRPRSLKVHSATARGLTLIAASTTSPAAPPGFLKGDKMTRNGGMEWGGRGRTSQNGEGEREEQLRWSQSLMSDNLTATKATSNHTALAPRSGRGRLRS